MTAQSRMTAEDARNVVRIAARDDTSGIDVPELVEAANVLATEVRSLQNQLEQVRAAARRAPTQHPLVEGHYMILDESDGGPRYYLAGQPMHAGTAICLLTHVGWLPGRYEYVWKRGEELRPYFHFALPGIDDDVVICIPPNARLAWPHELLTGSS